MVEKKFRDSLFIEVPRDEMTFEHHKGGLEAKYNQKLLQENLPPTTGILTGDKSLVKTLGRVLPEETVIALEATEFVNVFGRVVSKAGPFGTTCLQYLYVWDYQAVPTHEADYEPIFVFLEGNRRYAIYDLVHYCSRRIDLKDPGEDGPGLNMVPGWHSFLPARLLNYNQADADLTVFPLSDQHLDSWWNIPDEMSRLKITDYLVDPFALRAPSHFMKAPDETSKTMCCSFLEIERALAEFEDPRQAIVEGAKRALTKCVGIFALHRLGAYLQLLNEMQKVGLIRLPQPISEGLSIATITQMLQKGFLTLTDVGQSLVKGLSHEKPEK